MNLRNHFRLFGIPAILVVACAPPLSRAEADDYTDLFRSAALHTQRAEYEQAIADYRAALQLRPDAPEAWNNLAVILYQMHQYAEAYADASKVWPKHAELKSAALIAGMAAVQCNRPQDAIAPLTALLALEPNNLDALLALASAHFAQQNFATAASVYERILSIFPKEVKALYGLAICYERQAEQCAAKLAHMPGGTDFSKLILAHYLHGIGDEKLAQEAFGASIASLAEPSPQAKSEYEKARFLALKSQDAFENLVRQAPESWEAAVFLGDVARQHSDLVSALKYYNQALTLQADNPAALLGLGTVYWELGNFDQATAFLEKARERNPHVSVATFELGNIAVRQHREKDAIPLLKQYIDSQPNALAARADLGRAYLHLGRYRDAATQLSQAAASDETGEIHYQLALALKKLGQDREAQTALEQSTRLRQKRLEGDRHRHEMEQTAQ